MVEKDLLPGLPCSDFLTCSQNLFQEWRIPPLSPWAELMSPLNSELGLGSPAQSKGSKSFPADDSAGLQCRGKWSSFSPND